MNIIIAGCGKVGYALAQQLNDENHNITIIDNSAERLQPALTAMDPDFPYSGEFRPLGSETGIKFILLGTVAGVIETFNMKKDTARFLKQVRPTLSPKDPAFPAWWEAHKSEWEA